MLRNDNLSCPSYDVSLAPSSAPARHPGEVIPGARSGTSLVWADGTVGRSPIRSRQRIGDGLALAPRYASDGGSVGEVKATMTVDDYLALTDGSVALDDRLEWVNGEMYAMAGGTPEHAAVASNVNAALWVALKGKPCRPTTGDQRIAINETGVYVYPDVVVVCGPFHRAADGISITNPSVVVEVLSPSTASFDRGGKFEHYTRMTSLTDYVLVEPETRLVTHYRRQSDGWLRRDYRSGTVCMMDGELSITVEDIFADLDNVTAGIDGTTV